MNQITNNFLNSLAKSKIVVILRNIELHQCEEFVSLLAENQLDTVEITLNSPDPFSCIELITKKFPKINIGAGTVIEKKDIKKLYGIVGDVKIGDHGTQLTDAIFGSSSGFKGEAIVELEELSKMRGDDPENKLNFKTANFENRIYSVTKC